MLVSRSDHDVPEGVNDGRAPGLVSMALTVTRVHHVEIMRNGRSQQEILRSKVDQFRQSPSALKRQRPESPALLGHDLQIIWQKA